MQPVSNSNPIMAALARRGLIGGQPQVQGQGQPSMMGAAGGNNAGPMEHPLHALAKAKTGHTTMIIQGLLKHLHKTNPDQNPPKPPTHGGY